MKRNPFFAKTAMLLLLSLLTLSPVRAATRFVQDVMLIGGTKTEVLMKVITYVKQGWSVIEQDLNDGCGSDSEYIYLLYKNDDYGGGFNYGSITGFYIYSWNGTKKLPPDTKTIGGRTYYLVPYTGGADFVEGKGDLNEGAGSSSDYIYLYYTRDPFPDGRVVTGISFNTTQSGALGTNGGTLGYDLNNEAGGAFIYMHVSTATALAPLQIGYGESGTANIPFYLANNAYPYSLSQQIYTAEDIGKAGTIRAISFYHRQVVETLNLEGVQVFMKQTDKESFAGAELDPMADFSKVYDGDIFFSGPGWVTIHLDTPFEYDGNSNLMICCYESSSTHSKGNTFTYHYAENKLRRSSSSNPFNFSGTLVGSENTTMRNDIQLNIIPSPYGNPTALTLTSATEKTASFSWRAPSGSSSGLTGYAWQYKKAGDATWSNLTTTTDTSASISGLSFDTEYLFRVKAIFGSKESCFTILRFITAVGLPYTMGFENGMPGWSEVDINMYVDVHITGIRADARHDGDYGYQFRCFDEDKKNQYLISPALPNNTSIDVSFYYRNHWASSNETFQVGYSTSTRDITAFNWRDGITAEGAEWKRYEGTFPTGTQYIAVRYTSNNYWFDLDDFEFVAHSDFAKPTGLSVDELGEKSVKLTWTAPDGAKGYAYQYKPVDGIGWSDEKSVSSASVTLSGLSANTTYDFRVKAFYGENASNETTIRFLTEGPMETLPHYQGFESGMGGWRLGQGSSLSGITAQQRHEGEYGFVFDEGCPKAQYLRSPLLNGNSSKILSFYFKNYSVQTGESTYDVSASSFHVGWSTATNRLSDFQESPAVEAAAADWKRQSYQLPEGTKYVYIKVDEQKAWLYVDDISITDVPLPEAVEATVMGETKYVTTFFSGSKSWRLPEGALAYTVSKQGDDLVFYRLGDESNIIPAGRAVVIVADKAANDTETTKVINLTITGASAPALLYGNILTGSDTPVDVSGGKIGGKTVYVLGIVDGKLDFYPFTGNVIPAGKAYYLGD